MTYFTTSWPNFVFKFTTLFFWVLTHFLFLFSPVNVQNIQFLKISKGELGLERCPGCDVWPWMHSAFLTCDVWHNLTLRPVVPPPGRHVTWRLFFSAVMLVRSPLGTARGGKCFCFLYACAARHSGIFHPVTDPFSILVSRFHVITWLHLHFPLHFSFHHRHSEPMRQLNQGERVCLQPDRPGFASHCKPNLHTNHCCFQYLTFSISMPRPLLAKHDSDSLLQSYKPNWLTLVKEQRTERIWR